LPLSEIHVLAGTDIKSIEDLRGKRVSFGPAGAASSLTGTIVFQRLGVNVEQVLMDNATALQKLKSGELAALVRVIGKPVDFFAHIPANSGLHLVPIPFSKIFADHYTLGEFTSQEYPTLIPHKEKIDTIAVPAVLAVFNWPKDTFSRSRTSSRPVADIVDLSRMTQSRHSTGCLQSMPFGCPEVRHGPLISRAPIC
jgi:TRAP-type uncharacterized transport system substrate-binding protein